jgi:outer membrane lipoprotein-sorting protein
MTHLLPLLVLAQPTGAPAIFDQCVQAHRKLDRATIAIEVDAKFPQHSSQSKLELAYVRPNHARIRLTEPETPHKLAIDRTFYLLNNRLIGYDAKNNQYLERPVSTQGTLAARLTAALGGMEDAAKVAMDPDELKTYLNNFRGLDGWKINRGARETTLTRSVKSADAASDIQLKFDGQTGLFRSASLSTHNSSLNWTYRYGTAPRSIGFTPPRTALRVETFYVPGPPPTYANRAARDIMDRSAQAYNTLRGAHFEVSDGEQTTKVWLTGRMMRESQPRFDWAYDGSNLTIIDHATRTYRRGRSSSPGVLTYLSRLEKRADPLTRALASGGNPVQSILRPDLTVRVAGQLSLSGTVVDIVQMTAPGIRISAQIRRDNRLFQQIVTDTLNSQGQVVSRSERNFRYVSFGQPLPATTFQLARPAGYTEAPLPARQ